MQNLSNKTNKIVDKILAKQHILLPIVSKIWQEVRKTNPDFSQLEVIRILNSVNDRNKKICILHMKLANTNLATLIKFYEQEILDKINFYLGQKAIDKIKINW